MSSVRPPLSKITDYPAYLETCWQEHLAPRAADAPTVISLFAGCGGSSLGYSMAGFRELLAVEWNDNAVETFKLNFPDVPVYHGDINKLTVAECLKLAELEPRELDILDGSPPCQGFSTAGKRKFTDDRNQLFRQYVRLLRGLQPKVFVMENVSGMVKGKMKLIFAEILRELKASGYKVKVRLLNAMYFGVPQSRQRLVFIGVREDLGIEPSHPKAETRPISLRNICGDALGSKSQRINADKLSVYPHVTLSAMSFLRETILTHDGRREPTKYEIMTIGSFPSAYRFYGNNRQYWRQIGNSVPPLMMRSIARHIRQNILG